MKLQKIGMRTIKTGIAVCLTLLISNLLNLDSPFFASIAAILAMKASVSESLSLGKNRMLGTIFGGIVALLFTYFVPINTITISLGIIIIIYTCNLLGWRKSIELATMVFLSIIINYAEGSRLAYALNRTLATLVGLVIGTLINYLIVPPKSNHEKFIEESITKIHSEFKNSLEKLIWHKEFCPLGKLKELLNELENEYRIFKKDMKLIPGKDNEAHKFEVAFQSFVNIYYHLNTIFTIGEIPALNEDNIELIEGFFNREMPEEDNTVDKLSIIYNYHINKIMEEFNTIDSI